MTITSIQFSNLANKSPTLHANYCLLALALSTPSIALADEPTRLDEPLETIVVTGTRTAKALQDSPVRVEVVTREEIAQTNALDLADAIQNTPGILLREIHGKDGYQAYMQGADSKRVLVLIDGEPVSQSTNRQTDLSQIGVSNIQQIEIVKGPTSALYGSGAIGGVINVITQRNNAPLTYFIKGDVGSYGDQNVDGNKIAPANGNVAGNIAFQSTVWDGYLSADFRNTEGFNLPPKNPASDPTDWTREGSEGTRINSTAELGFSPNEYSRYFINASLYDEEIKSTYFSGTNTPYSKTEHLERYAIKSGADWQLNDFGDLKLRYFYEDAEDRVIQNAGADAIIEHERTGIPSTQKLSTQWDYAPFPNVLRTLGIEVDVDTLDQPLKEYETSTGTYITTYEVKNKDSLRKTFYFQDDIFINDQLELLPGVRVQHDSRFGRQVTPKVNARYNLDLGSGLDSFIRFGAGQGYRAPTLKEQFYVFDHSQYGYKVMGDPELSPEYSNSLQLGWGLGMYGRFSMDINLFRNWMRDLIETQFSAMEGGIAVYNYQNISRAFSEGVELTGHVQLSDSLSFSGGYTYLEAENNELNNRLPKQPRHQVKGSVKLDTFKGSFLSLSARWESESYFDIENDQRSPSHHVLDLKAGTALFDGLSIYGGIDNLTNTQKDFTSHGDLRPREGRYVYLGLKLEH